MLENADMLRFLYYNYQSLLLYYEQQGMSFPRILMSYLLKAVSHAVC